MERAVFLDRDGTIARYQEYCRRPEDFELLPGAGQAIRRLNEAGLRVFVLTNQSAIGRGWLTPEGLEAIHDKLRRELAQLGARLDAIYVCPHAPEAACACRKPGTALLEQAAREWGVSLKDSYVVGDRWLDIRSGLAAGATAVLVRSGHPPEPSEGIVPHHAASTLDEAVQWMMSRERGWLPRYRELTEAMYEVRRRCPRLGILGVSALHPRHSVPPVHVELAERLAAGNGHAAGASRPSTAPGPSGATLAWRGLRCLVAALSVTLDLGSARLRLGHLLRRAAREPASVILKTWRFGPETLGWPNDFYYGTLPPQLQARGVSCLVLSSDFRERVDAAYMQAILRRPGVRQVPGELVMPLWAPLASLWRQWRAAVALRRLAAQATDPMVAQVAAAACRESLQPAALRNGLHFDVMRAAVRCWRPKAVVTLYEGQPWEKAAWHGVKAADPACLVVGYQHTVIMPHSLSLLSPNVSSWERSVPDVVLCLGEATRQALRATHEPAGSRLISFGTFRQLPVSDRPAPHPLRRTVLVVPETGIPREATRLFDVAVRAAALLPDHRFVFRSHPALPFERLRSGLAVDPATVPNVEVSDRASITDDFERSSIVLYRGSSSVLYAVLYGLKPIYLEDPAYFDVDPLADAGGWRDRVASPEALREAAQAYLSAPRDAAQAQWHEAVAQIRQYVQAVDEEAVERFVESIGLGTERRKCGA